MHDGQHRAGAGRGDDAPVAVSHFAAEVVSRLVSREGGDAAAMREALVDQMVQAVRSHDPRPLEALKPHLRRARVSMVTLAELYIPEVARRLGQGWHDDTMTFAEVTIGVARLQAILRAIGTQWSADEDGARDGPTVLMLLPAGEQHTLGAMVATARLRRLGVSVCLRIGPGVPELRELFGRRGFDAVLISIASTDKLDVCRNLVKTLKDFSGNTVPIAVGGAVLQRNEDELLCLGADIVTDDLEAALQACGLTGSLSRVWKRA